MVLGGASVKRACVRADGPVRQSPLTATHAGTSMAGMRTSVLQRRQLLALLALLSAPRIRAQADPPERRWFDAAEAMRRLALSWGDQPYGAVVVQGGRIVGQGPSQPLLALAVTATGAQYCIIGH